LDSGLSLSLTILSFIIPVKKIPYMARIILLARKKKVSLENPTSILKYFLKICKEQK